MKTVSNARLIFGLILLQSFISTAQAQSIQYTTRKETTPVTETSLKLLGKGYADKKDPTRSFALACTGERADGQCASARFVYWQGDVANYIGQGFYIPYHQNKEGQTVVYVEALQGALQLLLPRTVGAHEDAKTHRFLAIATSTAVTGVGFAVGMPFLGLIYSILFIIPDEGIKGFKASAIAISAHDLDSVTRDQKGWNWSSNAKKIKTKTFNRVIDDLTLPEGQTYYKVPRFSFGSN